MSVVYEVNEKNHYTIKFVLTDQDGTPVGSGVVGTLYLTQYYYNNEIKERDKYHLAIVNARNVQYVKGANNVTLSASGTVTWNVQPADCVRLNQTVEKELHCALFTWLWGGTKKNSQEVYLWVKKIPFAY